MNPKRVILSRTDSIGDVMLTLPMAGFLKSNFPGIEVFFLGRKYTEPVVACCPHVDEFIDFDSFENQAAGVEALQRSGADGIVYVLPNIRIAKMAKTARIPYRVGTSRRWFHKLYCNKRIALSRRKSDLHESQLNLKLLRDFGIHQTPDLEEVLNWMSFNPQQELSDKYDSILTNYNKNIILHPKSQGSAREWGINNFSELMFQLSSLGVGVYVTGTEKEGKLLKDLPIEEHENVYDMTGKMSLAELISFISRCDGLVAASTGPLHIAAALGIRAVGLYSPIRPIHPGRWGAIGRQAVNLSFSGKLDDGANVKNDKSIEKITPREVLTALGLTPPN